MDNNNMNEEDKYTNYTYQGGQQNSQGNAGPGSYQAPSQEERMRMNGAANNIYQQNDPSYSGSSQNGYNNGYNNGYQQPNGQNGYNNGYNNGYQQNGYNNGYTQYNYNNAPVNNNDGTSVGALVCGIISLVLGCWGVGIVTGIIALVLSSKYKKAHNGVHNGQSKAGFICGLIGVILNGICIVYYIIIFVVAAAGMAGASAVSYYNW
ncbi:uncharacterized protein BN606_01774 [Butyrivibrio sp. CAG:318]|nr:uncharacterized protein BN606_01774 [Butyrivibrio sp. CAG:318]